MSYRLHNLRRFWFSPLLAALLVVLQMGAVLHALRHVSDAQRPDSPTLPQHVACPLCAAYAGAASALVATAPAPLLDAAPAAAPAEPRLPAALPSPALPYQVRAPPVTAGV